MALSTSSAFVPDAAILTIAPKPSLRFDGRNFGVVTGESLIPMMSILYLAKKARQGDEVAKETLNAFSVFLHDETGQAYWPMS